MIKVHDKFLRVVSATMSKVRIESFQNKLESIEDEQWRLRYEEPLYCKIPN